MKHEVDINLAEKQRQRQTIDQQIQSFLKKGGNITVVPTPTAAVTRPRGSIWQDSEPAADVLD